MKMAFARETCVKSSTPKHLTLLCHFSQWLQQLRMFSLCRKWVYGTYMYICIEDTILKLTMNTKRKRRGKQTNNKLVRSKYFNEIFHKLLNQAYVSIYKGQFYFRTHFNCTASRILLGSIQLFLFCGRQRWQCQWHRQRQQHYEIAGGLIL